MFLCFVHYLEIFVLYLFLASVRIAVDGGAVQWEKFMNSLPEDAQKSAKLPDLITGDFDSITENIMNKYKKKGCKVKQSLFL